MFNHVKIQAGIPKLIANSAENGIIAQIDLTVGTNGAALDTVNGWIPQIAQAKSGVWVDNEVITGRTLQAIEDQNVTETMQVIVDTGTTSETMAVLKTIRQLVQLARDYWQTNEQPNPVYLNVFFEGAPGEQYALIYNIDVTETMDAMNPQRREITMTIEREPYWRPIAPGLPATVWSLQKNGMRLGIDVDSGQLDFAGSNYATKKQTVYNCCEQDLSQSFQGFYTTNWIDIDAEQIDGDAPALVTIASEPSDCYDTDIMWAARSTLPRRIKAEDGTYIYRYNNFNAGDINTGESSVSPATSTYGLYSWQSPTTGNRYLAPDGTLVWQHRGDQLPLRNPHVDLNLLRGTFQVFVRMVSTTASQTTIAGNSVKLYAPGDDTSVTAITSRADIQTIYDAGLSGTLDPLLIDFGTVALPFTFSEVVSSEGLGLLSVMDDQGLLKTTLYIELIAGGLNTTSIWDVVFFPVNETTCYMEYTHDSATTGNTLLDNTGYFANGKPEQTARQYNTEGANYNRVAMATEFRGGDLTLTPGVDNRLHFMWADKQADGLAPVARTVYTYPAGTGDNVKHTVAVHIIPRWRGVRDV